MVEKYLKIKPLSTYEVSQEGHLIFTGPPIWASCPPMVSLYTLLIRIGRWYKNDMRVMEFLEKFSKTTYVADGNYAGVNSDPVYVEAALPKMKLMRENGIDPKKLSEPVMKGVITSHNCGIHMAPIECFKEEKTTLNKIKEIINGTDYVPNQDEDIADIDVDYEVYDDDDDDY